MGVSTAVEFLRKNNVQVDDNPNARIDDMAVQLLFKEYSNDKDAKTHGQNQGRNNNHTKPTNRPSNPPCAITRQRYEARKLWAR